MIAPPNGRIGVVQIAGLIARRIVCWVKEGQAIGAGERIGMIRFGSRVDVYLPAGTVPLVSEGQTVARRRDRSSPISVQRIKCARSASADRIHIDVDNGDGKRALTGCLHRA